MRCLYSKCLCFIWQACDIMANSLNGFRTGSKDDDVVTRLVSTECQNYFTDSVRGTLIP